MYLRCYKIIRHGNFPIDAPMAILQRSRFPRCQDAWAEAVSTLKSLDESVQIFFTQLWFWVLISLSWAWTKLGKVADWRWNKYVDTCVQTQRHAGSYECSVDTQVLPYLTTWWESSSYGVNSLIRSCCSAWSKVHQFTKAITNFRNTNATKQHTDEKKHLAFLDYRYVATVHHRLSVAGIVLYSFGIRASKQTQDLVALWFMACYISEEEMRVHRSVRLWLLLTIIIL